MKHIIPVLLLQLLCSIVVKAQQKIAPVLPFIDTSVLRIPPPVLTYKGNTNHFDIYSATPDNMPVIMPDSTIHFNMPTGNYNLIKAPMKKPDEK